MSSLAPASRSSGRFEARLLVLAAFFLFLFSLGLTIAQTVRLRSWEAPLGFTHWLGFATWALSFLLIYLQTRRRLPYRDPYLIPLAGLITGWGLMTIWRVAPAFGLRQSLWVVLAAAIILLGLRLPGDLSYLRNYKYLWLTGGLVLTGLTLIFGTNPSGIGPRLWLGCCGVYFQPSEPLKLLLIIYLAAYLADRQHYIPGLFPLLAPTLIMAGLAILLLVVQRDLGTASIFLVLYTTVVYFATGRGRFLVLGLAVLLLAGFLGYLLFDVVQLRIEAWLNPWLDPSGRSYQIVQSLMAVAAGGLLGRGPGLGSPTVVPVNHSDFIFASIAEETGLAGTLVMLMLSAILLIRGLRVAIDAPDNFRRYLAVGLVTYLTAQSILIVGGNLRLLPLTGVTLPFVSYGGSSLVTSFIALLFLVQISNREGNDPAPFTNARPALVLGGFLLLGILAVAIVNGWWAFYRGPSILTRTDNPRRVIADRFVRRGAILGQDETPLSSTEGLPGNFVRKYWQPGMGPLLGYLHPRYGQGGLEDSLDDFLRGLTGPPAATIWWNYLLYGQPPPGSDVRLSLSPALQMLADDELLGQTGALVLLNAESGEILAMSSKPGFNPNDLDESWDELIGNQDAPLLNRATQGQYHPGTVLGPLLMTEALASGEMIEEPDLQSFAIDNDLFTCAVLPQDFSFPELMASGCPGPVAAIGQILGPDRVEQLFERIGLFRAPPIRLPTAEPTSPLPESEGGAIALGLNDLRVSPLQIGLAGAALSAQGLQPAGQIASAIRNPGEEWQLLSPLDTDRPVFEATAVERATALLADPAMPVWQTISVTPVGSEGGLTWYLGGTTTNWSGTPLTLVIVLESDDPARIRDISLAIFGAALNLEP